MLQHSPAATFQLQLSANFCHDLVDGRRSLPGSATRGLGWGPPRPLPAQVDVDPEVSQTVGGLLHATGSLGHGLPIALGMALAELDGLGSAVDGGWLTAPPSALLLPAGEAAITALEEVRRLTPDPPIPADRTDPGRSVEAADTADAEAALLGPGETAQNAHDNGTSAGNGTASAFTVKWKVASGDDALEQRVLETLLERLPHNGRLRLDANGGWKRATAWRWAERLAGEARLDWLEQPLPPDDQAGLQELARLVPVALDESLRLNPSLVTGGWGSWQVRRPLAEADPRPLLAALRAGTPRLMLSTAFETGIGRRFLLHLAGLQAPGPTPTAPGLAPGWRPRGDLFAHEPEAAWEAAG
jgi:O-succinylbenzoate synthase